MTIKPNTLAEWAIAGIAGGLAWWAFQRYILKEYPK